MSSATEPTVTSAPSPDEINATYPGDLATPTPFVPMVVPLLLEVASNLVPWFQQEENTLLRFQDGLMPLMRESLFYDLGVRVPQVRLRERTDWQDGTFVFSIFDVPVHTGQVSPDLLLVGERPERLASLDVEAQSTAHPATGRLVSWVPRSFEDRIQPLHVPIWDAVDYLVLVMAVALRKHGSEFVGVEEVQAMMQLLEPAYPTLVREVRSRLSLPALRRVLRSLVREQFSICNLRQILEVLLDASEVSQDTEFLVDSVRMDMRRYLTHRHSFVGRQVAVFTLSPELQAHLEVAFNNPTDETVQQWAQPLCQAMYAEVAELLANLPVETPNPALLCPPSVRRGLRRWLEVPFPFLHLLSWQEIDPHYSVQVLAVLGAEVPDTSEASGD